MYAKLRSLLLHTSLSLMHLRRFDGVTTQKLFLVSEYNKVVHYTKLVMKVLTYFEAGWLL